MLKGLFHHESTYPRKSHLNLMFAVLFLAFPLTSAHSQSYRGVFAGVSAGRGYGFDIGYSSVYLQSGVGDEFFGSVWTPQFTNRAPSGQEGYYSSLVPTGKTTSQYALSLGYRHMFGAVGIGIMGDYIISDEYQDYIAPTTEASWHSSAQQTTRFGISGNVSLAVSDNVSVNAFFGENDHLQLGFDFFF